MQPSPPDYTFDETRLAALAEFKILDTPAEPEFDDIVQLASDVCETPVALVTLVAADRQWFKAKIGVDACETDLASSICVHALIEPEILIVPDLTLDERTRSNPLVAGDPRIRFYAGAPVRTGEGVTLGVLCVIDMKPRPAGLTPKQQRSLKNLARLVMNQLELRKMLADRDALLIEKQRAEVRRNALLKLGERLGELRSMDEMTRAAAMIVGEALDASRIGFGRIDDSGNFLTVGPDWTAHNVPSIVGRYRFAAYGDLVHGLLQGDALVIDDVKTDPRTSADPQPLLNLQVRSLVNMPVRDRGRTVALLLAHDREPRVWTPEVLTFLRNVADRVEAGVARLKAERDQRVLNRELSHRLKNTFAMVQAIAGQTLRGVPDQTPVETFGQRLHALSKAHDILLTENFTRADLEEIVRSVLKPLAPMERIALRGPHVELGPQATLTISLLLHELATNAMKYGALSNESGRIDVTWSIENSENDAQLVLAWRESQGPIVEAPTRKGFGSRLTRMGLTGRGGVDMRYLPTGFEADFKAPLAEVQVLQSDGS